jgi:hypothetical protein
MYAEEVGHYWKTSRSSPDVWVERAKKQIEKLGGTVLMEGFGNEPATGRAAFALAFEIGEDRFRLVWPVLPSKTGDGRAAKVQAATMLYHDVKAKSISAKVLGARAAFFSYLMLPDGRTAAEASTPELLEAMPKLLMGGA